MDLEKLLMEESNIKEKVENAMTVVKSWFEEKMEQAKAVFQKIKEKVVEKIKGVRGVLTKDIKDPQGKVLFKKGDKVEKVVSSIKSGMTEVKSNCDKVIKTCTEGIKAVTSKDAKKASEKKELTIRTFGEITARVAIISSLLIGCALVKSDYMDYKDGKRNEIYRNKYSDVHDKSIDKSIKYVYNNDIDGSVKYSNAINKNLADKLDRDTDKAASAKDYIKSKFKKEDLEIDALLDEFLNA